MARPKVEIPAVQVAKLAEFHCTTDEIASFFGVSRDTIERRYRKELQQGKAASKMLLRQKQYELAKSGDKTMLIWLGKQWLGQNDKIAIKDSGRGGAVISIHELLKIADAKKRKLATTQDAADAKKPDAV
jgi:predicted transcriptional regulator